MVIAQPEAFVTILIATVLISLISTLAYKYTTDQKKMKRIKEKLKGLQAQMKEARGDQDRMLKLNAQIMKSHNEYSMASMRSIIFTIVPVMIIFIYLQGHVAYTPIAPGEEFSLLLDYRDAEAIGDVMITLPDSNETVGVMGKVVRIVGPNQIGVTKGVGIEFLKIEAKQTKLFNNFLEELLSARGMGCRKFPRIDAKITVQFKNPAEMGKALTNNLSRGGIFIETKTELNLGSVVSLVLVHPVTGEALDLDGEIVHIRKSLKPASSMKLSDGIGINFTNLSKVKQEKITHFLKTLLIQKKKRKPRKKS